MKEKRVFSAIGILTYILLSLIDRIIIAIPDYIYIPVGLTAIVLIVIRIVKENKKRFNI